MLFKIVCSENHKLVEIDGSLNVKNLKQQVKKKFGERLENKDIELKNRVCNPVKLHDKHILNRLPTSVPNIQVDLVEGYPQYTLYVEIVYNNNDENKCIIL